MDKTDKELTVTEARRLASAAKSLLSRRYNEMNEALRNNQSTFEDFCAAREAYQQQEERFQAAVREWKRLQGAHQHRCESAGQNNEECWAVFSCDETACTGKRYCPPCLNSAVQISSEVMGDY